MMNQTLYAIIRENGKLTFVEKPIQHVQNVSKEELCNSHNYATSLGEAFTSAIPRIKENLLNNDVNKKNRMDAIDMQHAISELNKNNDIVAFSHRYGGKRHFDWNFGEKVSFHIYTIFGYGAKSEFAATFKYNDVSLVPFSYYVIYISSDYGTVTKCTHHYKLDYSEWKHLMQNCLSFYNAIAEKNEANLVSWLNNQLSTMVGGLEEMMNTNSYGFFNPKYNYLRVRNYVKFGKDYFWLIKSRKIANSLMFVTNIEALPFQINKVGYIKRLYNLCMNFKPMLRNKIKEEKCKLDTTLTQIESLEKQGDYPLYSRLYNKFGYRLTNYRTIYRLLHIAKRIDPSITKVEIRERIEKFTVLKREIDDLGNQKRKLQLLLNSLQEDAQKMDDLLLKKKMNCQHDSPVLETV